MKKAFLSLSLLAATAICTSAVPITFRVDLGPRINTGEFDASVDRIDVRGSFDGWGAGLTLAPENEGSTIYSGMRDITGEVGTTVNYKFVQVSNGTDLWESTPDRSFRCPQRKRLCQWVIITTSGKTARFR